jgi:hypothetical protein
MTLQAIRNALFNQLVTCGPYAASEISTCSYGVLETAATCALLVYLPGNDTNFEELTGTPTGGLDYNHWSIAGGVYIRDSGDPQRLLNLVWQAHDDLFGTIRKDRSLGSTADNARLVAMSFDPRAGIEAGGAFWAEVRWRLRADELDSF